VKESGLGSPKTPPPRHQSCEKYKQSEKPLSLLFVGLEMVYIEYKENKR
jgi:hypothetical protein